MIYGWAGKRLKVYLTEGRIVEEETPEELRLGFLGGRGFNSKMLFDELKPGIDPLGPDNILMITAGPLTGTLASCCGRWTATAKSPLTGILGDANGGGDFSPELKYAGYDQLVFYGKSPKPVYLWIKDGHAELRDAAHLWGLDTWQGYKQLLKENHDPCVRMIGIGPAGENKVLFACILADGSMGVAGRTGMGAVMGSKNLKAVAIRGSGSVKIARPDEFEKQAKHFYNTIMNSPYLQSYGEHGSLSLVKAMALQGAMGVRNQQYGFLKGWENITDHVFETKFKGKRNACFGCPVQCGAYYDVKEGPYITHCEGPEMGSVIIFCAKLDNINMAAALKATTICNYLGMDAVSCGGTIAFAMEARQRGLLSDKDCDGLDLTWGNMDAVIELLPKIARREGFGNILADGSVKASRHIKGSEICLVHIKGLESINFYPGVDMPKGGLLGAATSTRGFDHLRGFIENLVYHHRLKEFGGEELVKSLKNPYTVLGRGAIQALENDFKAAFDSLEICYFMLGWSLEHYKLELDHDDLARICSAATGVDMTGDDLLKIGERIYNVERAFNIREGLGRKDDTLPPRYFVQEISGRRTVGLDPAKFNAMLDEYYRFKGWDNQGVPTRKKLEELDLGYIADQIGAS